MGLLGKLFGKKPTPNLELETLVGEYLLKLPRCSKYVVAVSPKYGDENYSGEIVIQARELAPWAEYYAESEGVLIDDEEEAARKALPLWLRSAEISNQTLSYVPHYFYKVLRPYTLDFIKKYHAKIICLECGSAVGDISMEKHNERREGGWIMWTDIWTCPSGHRLYHEEHELHFHVRR